MLDLQGKKALVTGATRGIGRAIVLALENMGATVIGTATTAEGATAIKGQILDISDPQSIETLLSNLHEIDILINNAGITRDNLLLRMKDQEWTSVINTNLNAIYRLTKGCVKYMLKKQWGRIISISSVAGVMGNPGQTNYAATKAGIIGFSKSLALELASRGITVNVVAPGFIDTDMTQQLNSTQKTFITEKIPVARLGKPAEIADAVAFLASTKASYITGETLQINGGMYMQ